MADSRKKNPGNVGTGTHTYSHADFTYVRRKRSGGRHHAAAGPEEDGELNIVPYLDILINLIMFLLVAQATLVSLGLIDVTAPTYTPASANPGQTTPPQQQLKLTIGVARDGFYIAAKGGVLPGQEEEGPSEITADGVQKTTPTIPKRPDGSFDFPQLSRKLRGIKTAFPATKAVYVAADANIPYEVIVKTLDTSREDGQGELFPAVAFTQIN